jgi:hypothetical protein
MYFFFTTPFAQAKTEPAEQECRDKAVIIEELSFTSARVHG